MGASVALGDTILSLLHGASARRHDPKSVETTSHRTYSICFDEMTSRVAENCSRLLFLEARPSLQSLAKARQPRPSVVSQLNDFMANLAPAIPPVPLPPFNNIINLPPQPQNPPVSKDVVDGHWYKEDMIVAHGMQNQHDSYYHEYLQVFRSVVDGLVDDDDLADTLTYELNLIQARAGVGVFNSLAFRHPRSLFRHIYNSCCPRMVSCRYATIVGPNQPTPRQTYGPFNPNCEIERCCVYTWISGSPL